MEPATSALERLDLRRRRAQALTAVILDEIFDVIPECDRKAVYARLFRVLYDNGASWVTDEDRARLGMEPRDKLGWTASERVAEERRRLDMLQMMQVHVTNLR